MDTKFQTQFFRFFEDVIHHHLPNVEDSIDSTFEPQVQRPPRPLNSTLYSSDLKKDWDNVLMSEIQHCGEVLQHHTCCAICHKYGGTDHCQFLFPYEIVEQSSYDPQTRSVILQCKDSTVNYFNPYILVFCRHNHDIKCILSGKGTKAAMFYISDYITKMDVKTYEVLSLLSCTVARIPDKLPGTVSDVEHGKQLLHKCLSQFGRQQQIHAQQAARYIQGFDDGISSHCSVAMLSSLLLAHIKNLGTEGHTSLGDSDEDDEVEHAHLCIATDKDGNLVEANQIHHYLYCADSLCHMNFYDFCRCVRLESVKKSANIMQ
jgi:hypothetical protein